MVFLVRWKEARVVVLVLISVSISIPTLIVLALHKSAPMRGYVVDRNSALIAGHWW